MSSVQWGAWGQGGMAARDAGVLARIERMGIGVLSPAQGLAVLGAVFSALSNTMVSFSLNLAVSPFDWARISQHMHPLPAVCKDVHAQEGGILIAGVAGGGVAWSDASAASDGGHGRAVQAEPELRALGFNP